MPACLSISFQGMKRNIHWRGLRALGRSSAPAVWIEVFPDAACRFIGVAQAVEHALDKRLLGRTHTGAVLAFHQLGNDAFEFFNEDGLVVPRLSGEVPRLFGEASPDAVDHWVFHSLPRPALMRRGDVVPRLIERVADTDALSWAAFAGGDAHRVAVPAHQHGDDEIAAFGGAQDRDELSFGGGE